MKINILLEQLIKRQDLSKDEMRLLMQACMKGELNEAEMASFLVLMRAKGETVGELSTAAKVMLKLAEPLYLGNNLIDIVGTGGDAKNIFNVSTISAFVAAGAGAKVAKHGGNSVSGRSGSADLLLKAGFELLLSNEQFVSCMNRFNLCFLFAPHFHKAMLHAKKVRQQLGIRTFFNFLGPLINPAKPSKQIVGVFSNQWLKPIAEVLKELGSERAMIINSKDGLDEVSVCAPTEVVEYYQGQYHHWQIDPKTYGCFHANLDSLIINSPEDSLALGLQVLQGEKGAARDIILLNAGLAIYCANLKPNLEEAIQAAALAIDSQKALNLFNQLQQFTHSFSRQSHE